jgi:ATP-dependent Lhr-like helicase
MTFKLRPEIRKSLSAIEITELNDFQIETYNKFANTNANLILSAGTGTGKTEAVLIPITNYLLGTSAKGLKIIYIMPLIALANDQADRVEKFFRSSDLTVFKYHGEVSAGKKKKFFNDPTDVLIITPESLQGILVSDNKFIFNTVSHFVIDEIHYFFDNERGNHMYNSIWLINKLFSKTRIIGISATININDQTKKWLSSINGYSLDIISAKNVNKRIIKLDAHDSLSKNEDLANFIFDKKCMVFFQSKKDLEMQAILMNKHKNKKRDILVHHGNLSKLEREKNENTIKNHNTSIFCTSTLELGIDIGDIDIVFFDKQPNSVSSFLQRIGRSGRRSGIAKAKIYCQDDYNVVYSYIIKNLAQENIVEEPKPISLSYAKLSHFILTILVIQPINDVSKFLNFLNQNIYYTDLQLDKLLELLDYMVLQELIIYRQDGRITIFDKGSILIKKRDYYSFFIANSDTFSVFDTDNNLLGFIAGYKLKRNNVENIGISGHSWKIVELNDNSVKLQKDNNLSGTLFTSLNEPPITELVRNSLLKYMENDDFTNCNNEFVNIYKRSINELKILINSSKIIELSDKEINAAKMSEDLRELIHWGYLMIPNDSELDFKGIITKLEEDLFKKEYNFSEIKFKENVPNSLLKEEFIESNYDFKELRKKIKECYYGE